MPLTGAANLAFLLLHLATVRFADPAAPVAARVAKVLTDPLFALLYAAGIASLTMHAAHGFWSLTQSLGLNHPGWNGLIKGCAILAAALMAGIFSGIILLHRYPVS
jgi:succinate dehydrogenase / fumarate reductase cytochrome b subunit